MVVVVFHHIDLNTAVKISKYWYDFVIWIIFMFCVKEKIIIFVMI